MQKRWLTKRSINHGKSRGFLHEPLNTYNFLNFNLIQIKFFMKFTIISCWRLEPYREKNPRWLVFTKRPSKPGSWLELYLGLSRRKDRVLVGFKLLKSHLWYICNLMDLPIIRTVGGHLRNVKHNKRTCSNNKYFRFEDICSGGDQVLQVVMCL